MPLQKIRKKGKQMLAAVTASILFALSCIVPASAKQPTESPALTPEFIAQELDIAAEELLVHGVRYDAENLINNIYAPTWSYYNWEKHKHTEGSDAYNCMMCATWVSYFYGCWMRDTCNYTQPSHDITLNGVLQKTQHRDITYTQEEADQIASQILYPKYNDPELGLKFAVDGYWGGHNVHDWVAVAEGKNAETFDVPDLNNPPKELTAGDILIFRTQDVRYYHAGIYAGDGMVWHCTHTVGGNNGLVKTPLKDINKGSATAISVNFVINVTDDEPETYPIKIQKEISSLNPSAPISPEQLAGWYFEVAGTDGAKTVIGPTDGTGSIVSDPVFLQGNYTVTELGRKTGDGYSLEGYAPSGPQSISLPEQQELPLRFTNTQKGSQLKIEKLDKESGKRILADTFAFRVRRAGQDEWIAMTNPETNQSTTLFQTGKDGTVTLPEKLPSGSYELVEAQCDETYLLDETPIPFQVDGEKTTVTVQAVNAPKKGTITVSKTGEVFSHVTEADGIYQPEYKVQGLAGAVFVITALEDIQTLDGVTHAKAGDVVQTITTGPDGTAVSEPLYLGRYQVKERTAPEGMVINPEPQEAILSADNQTAEIPSVSLHFSNERQKAALSLKKTLEQDSLFSIGAQDEWKNVSFGLFAGEELTAADGTFIPTDGLLETVPIDENGNAVFQTDIPCGASLYVQEFSTDGRYLLNVEKYPVVFAYAGQDVSTVEIAVNGGEAITNNIKRGKVTGMKIDQDGFALGGAVIGLFRFDETEYTKETALMVTESNEIGYFEFDGIPAGSWVVREIAPPQAFLLSEETYPVEMTEDGQNIEIVMENQIIRGTAETTKVDADYPEHKLSGAIFKVYADVDNNEEFDASIDKQAGEMAEIEPGLYQLKELAYGNYFLHEEQSPEFFVPDDGYYPFSITEDGAVVQIETEAGAGFLNQPQTGSLKIVKTADDGNVKGRAFLITGADFMGNPYEQKLQTDENGEISVTLRVGKYTISEIAGEDAGIYELPADQTVEIAADETVTVEMHNKLIPPAFEPPQPAGKELPHTGGNQYITALSILCALGAIGVFVFSLLTFRKRKRR